jgi:serine/threonine-protein kinase
VSEQKVCPTCGTEYPLSERFCPRDGTALRSASSSGDLVGSVVADRYHIIKKLGEGGMGAVYLAEHVKMGRKSALKVMHPGMNSDPDAIARFNREASNASRLSHPNICGIYDFGETPDGLIYLAMEFIEGKALADLVEKDGALQPARAASIVHQTADALQVAHDAGIVHRDLKPDNIMVAKHRDGTDLVKVVDFGIAKASSSEAQKVTKTGMVVGTPEYMSPEQLAGDKLDGRSDIYSLGLVAFNCLTGKLPFPSETAQEAMIMRLTDRPRTLSEMRPDVAWPEDVQAVLDKALARDSAERYQSAAQFGREFAAAVQEMPAVAATEGATQVIGAQSLAAATSAKTAPVAAVPKTRVAGAGESKSPAKGGAAAPAPVEKKTPLVPILAGVAVVAVVGYFGMTKLGGGSEPTAADSGAQVAQAPTPAPLQPQPTAPTGGTTPANTTPANTTPMSNPVNPGTPAPRTETRPTAPTTTPTTPATGNAMTQMEGWVTELQADGVTARTARRILAEVQTLQPTLRGIQLGESWYVAMLANVVLEDQDGTCTAARRVKELHTDRTRLGNADLALQGCQ